MQVVMDMEWPINPICPDCQLPTKANVVGKYPPLLL